MKVKLLFKDHEIGKDFWLNKRHLINEFYGEFYDFILNHGGKNDLENKNIYSKEDFINFALDWNSDGKDNCYGLGFAFHKYFLEVNRGSKLVDQSEDKFIGYCLHNDKFVDFINFLVTFFAWWRNDEHCTTFIPYNYADDFFESSWASLVDTAKLLYFTAETVFHWQSFRVKYAIDNIPGVILSDFNDTLEFEEKLLVPKVRVAGYEFQGFYDENDNLVESINKDSLLYGKLIRKDFYNYWEKEEKTIKKVIDPNLKKVDPA